MVCLATNQLMKKKYDLSEEGKKYLEQAKAQLKTYLGVEPEVEIYRERCKIRHGATNLQDIDIDLIDPEKGITVGNFVDIDRPPLVA